ncbi:hypothetical protein QUP01_001701 [Enterococcus faecalis]|uniref:ABC transporter permease subunit n=1 Tax=Enterococcus TaxID=1350 RepID=UPI000CF22751|nr:ABC transporter permease subunit [Enterococcus faecalis]EGO8528018.1 hypothetical protein [Enterococcus faecalis]EKZ0150387.1 hypothetical protein [Enterococcus faecalis]EME3240277.1 hypothetical protein [Enterococcus faecalis]NSN39331.1 hypothetical protein [Enterococcus faecalis]NVJ43627.1 ABC-2 family transporter protein [Enterococcus faecalis]
MRNNLFRTTIFIGKKELLEIKATSIKTILVMMLTIPPSIMISLEDGGSGILFNNELNIFISFIFASIFGSLLISDSMWREKEQKTLSMLLLSSINNKAIVMGKILTAVSISSIFQIIQLTIMFVLLVYKDSSFLYLFDMFNIVILPCITYFLGSIVILVSCVVTEKKLSEYISVVTTFGFGILIMWSYIFFGIQNNSLYYVMFLICIMVLNVVFTSIISFVIGKTMFFIK